jgi:hypothetical protein
MLEKDLNLYKVNYSKDLITESSYSETKEITEQGFATLIDLYEKILPQTQPKNPVLYIMLPGLVVFTGSFFLVVTSFHQTIFIPILCISFFIWIYGGSLVVKEKEEYADFKRRAWWCYNFIKQTSSYDDYIKKHHLVDWDKELIFNKTLEILIPDNLEQHYELVSKHLERLKSEKPINPVLMVILFVSVIVIYIIYLEYFLKL